MAVNALKRELKKIGFLQFTVAPMVREIRYRALRMKGPQVPYSYIRDLKSVATTRGWPFRDCQPGIVQRREPSRALPEDVLLIAKNGNRLIKYHRDARLSRDNLRGEMYYSHLSAVTHYPVPDTFVCEIPDVLVSAPDGEMITSEFEILTQSAIRGLLERPPIMNGIPAESDRLKGTYVSLLGWGGATNYGHWILDVLTRATLLEELPGDLRFLVPDPLLPFHARSLALLGIPEDRLVPVNSGWYRLERVLLCHAAARSIVLHGYHVHALRDRLVKTVIGADRNPKPWRRVYISRSKSRRKLVNEDELLPILREHGFESYNCEDLTFDEQVRLFSEAEAVLGSHGAGMNNQVFCNPGAKVVEIYNPIWWHHCICRVANIMGHEHWHTFGEDVRPDNSTYLSPKKLDRLLAYAFCQKEIVEDYY